MSEQSAHRALGLTDHEFDLICEKMGREPNGVELAMFSLLWSEHCAYKHSKKLLGKLPTEGQGVTYRIKSIEEGFERVANEGELSSIHEAT